MTHDFDADGVKQLVGELVSDKREALRKNRELRELLERWLRLPPNKPKRRQELYEDTERALKA